MWHGLVVFKKIPECSEEIYRFRPNTNAEETKYLIQNFDSEGVPLFYLLDEQYGLEYVRDKLESEYIEIKTLWKNEIYRTDF